jgi:hypothetical protein
MELTSTQLDTFTLEIPTADTSFFKAIAKRMGWKIKRNRRNMSNYERALDDVACGRVNEYESPEDLFNKLGI